MSTTNKMDATAAQLALGFDLSPCGPVVDAAAERQLIADIRDTMMVFFGLDIWDDAAGWMRMTQGSRAACRADAKRHRAAGFKTRIVREVVR